MAAVKQNRLRCCDAEAAERMEERIRKVRAAGDTLGGIVEITATCPADWVSRCLTSSTLRWPRPSCPLALSRGWRSERDFMQQPSAVRRTMIPSLRKVLLVTMPGGILAGISKWRAYPLRGRLGSKTPNPRIRLHPRKHKAKKLRKPLGRNESSDRRQLKNWSSPAHDIFEAHFQRLFG